MGLGKPPTAPPTEYVFTRYLAAKKTVDDRALNWHVARRLRDALRAVASGRPIQILEIGAGIGTMIERLLDWEIFGPGAPVVYTAVDGAVENLSFARQRLPIWAAARGFTTTDSVGAALVLKRGDWQVTVDLVADDFFRYSTTQRDRRWDVIVAHAFLDLVDLPTTLPIVRSLARSGALLYLTINFDGATILQPEIDRALDERIEALYHRTMDERLTNGKRSGDSRTGRHLFHRLREVGVEVVEMGSSDWVVFPGERGYPADEAYFLHFIVQTIGAALRGHPELDPDRFAAWIAERHAQIERGELLYVAHQIDVLGRVR